ncbi:Bug family tripartite tricarboxylate transporter substrate binding protein [Ottowia thiooxydans]|uniref:Bug family tripartite tricarboxylate transporter substrate binding protein n=1 Tax=Ottowia thiooxydans TaxID=219182 RepID=UPI00146EA3B0|nr:tripartite tricarboxylate transporter substrate binding protein [Ottowia thiooxydans]
MHHFSSFNGRDESLPGAIDTHRRSALRRLASLPLLAAPGLAWASDKPVNTPVNMIVPFAPGGTSDIIARTLAGAAARQTGGVFVVENRAGASGLIGLQAVAKAQTDGRSLLLGNIATQTIAPHLYKKVGYPTIKDFRPLILTGRTTNVVVVHPDNGIRNFKEMDARMRGPQALVYASGSIGGSPHLSFELLKQRLGWQCEHVPYKGAGPMITDLLGGQVKVAIDNLPTMLPLIRRGAVIPIGITSAQRWSEAKEIPTFSEMGIADYDVDAWFGVFAPRKMPDDVATRFAEIFRTAQEDPAVREKFDGLGARIDPLMLNRFETFIAEEDKRWSEVISRANIKVE